MHNIKKSSSQAHTTLPQQKTVILWCLTKLSGTQPTNAGVLKNVSFACTIT